MKNMKKWMLPACLILFVSVATIDLRNLENYIGQAVPNYIQRNNTPADNPLTNAGATLGRVLFYDKQLSANNTIACGSCHIQEFAFSDTALLSLGLHNGLTGKHSMRLPYSRFAQEERFFWDERANSLEMQTTMPIQDAIEMGFSGASGQPGFDSLTRKLVQVDYYKTLFRFAYGDTVVTEGRIKLALAQFVRSIFSFDSRFDVGLAQTNNLNAPFPNFTPQENQGKTIFLNPPGAGPGGMGAGCQGCHRAPEFDIDPITRNNGIPANPNIPGSADFNVTRAPSLRDLVNPQGQLNGPMMHNGIFSNLQQVVNHYNLVSEDPDNFNLDPRLTGPGSNLQLIQNQRDALVAFLRTLTSNDIYTHRKWSDPFDGNGNLQVVTILNEYKNQPFTISVYPNPAKDYVWIDLPNSEFEIELINMSGQVVRHTTASQQARLNLSSLAKGNYSVRLKEVNGRKVVTKRISKL